MEFLILGWCHSPGLHCNASVRTAEFKRTRKDANRQNCRVYTYSILDKCIMGMELSIIKVSIMMHKKKTLKLTHYDW